MKVCARFFVLALIYLAFLAHTSIAVGQQWAPISISDVVVEFKSVPPGSKVEVDGEYVCDTPCSRALKPGAHKITFRLDGYLPYESTVEVKDGMAPVVATLIQNVGWLTIKTNPPGIKVLIDGKPVGNTPIERYEITTGTHEVSVDDPRASSLVEKVTIEVGETKTLELTPIVKLGTLYVKAIDEKNNALPADVLVDGAPLGKAYQSIPLIIGKHRIRAKYQELVSWEEEVEIKEAESKTVQLQLLMAKEILKKGALFVETVDKEGNKIPASIYVDGELKGRAYQNIYLEPREYKIQATYDNLNWEGTVKIEEEKTSKIQANLKLNPLIRWLKIVAIASIAVVAVLATVLIARFVLKKLREREIKADAEAFKKEEVAEQVTDAIATGVIQDKLTIEISGPEAGLDIFINYTNTTKKTPYKLLVNKDDFVYVEKPENGAWLVRGDEKYISFKKREFSDGHRLYIDVGEGNMLLGYHFSEFITPKSFDELVKATKTLKVLIATGCKNIASLSALSGAFGTWILNLSGTGVSDIQPLANMKDLRVLDLSNTPVSNISVLANLNELKELSLKETAVSDISTLSNLTNLDLLDISGIQVTKISALARLKGLKKLYLRNVPITDVVALSNLNKLEILDLSGTKVSNITPLIGLTNLKWLGLVGTPVSNIAPLAKLKRLEWLGLSRTQVSDLSPLADLPKLRVLMLGGTKVSDLHPLSSIKDLEWLDISSTSVSDVSSLSNLKELKMLYMVGTKATKESVDRLQSQLPNCRIDYF